MGKMLSIARREMAGYFFSPMAYIVGAIFLCVCGFKFAPPQDFWFGSREWFILVPNQQASLRGLFEMMATALVVAAPLLTMRLVSEEYRSGTVETLLTAPVTDAQVILGKFLGAFSFFLTLLASTAVFLVLMFIYAKPDIGVILMGYSGLILLGGAFLAVGIFASTLSRHQLVAAIVSIVILAFFHILTASVASHTPAPINQIASRMNTMEYMSRFAQGLFDSQALVFFASLMIGFLLLSIKTLESRRWR